MATNSPPEVVTSSHDTSPDCEPTTAPEGGVRPPSPARSKYVSDEDTLKIVSQLAARLESVRVTDLTADVIAQLDRLIAAANRCKEVVA